MLTSSSVILEYCPPSMKCVVVPKSVFGIFGSVFSVSGFAPLPSAPYALHLLDTRQVTPGIKNHNGSSRSNTCVRYEYVFHCLWSASRVTRIFCRCRSRKTVRTQSTDWQHYCRKGPLPTIFYLPVLTMAHRLSRMSSERVLDLRRC